MYTKVFIDFDFDEFMKLFEGFNREILTIAVLKSAENCAVVCAIDLKLRV